MKLVLDESLPEDLRKEILGHIVFTAHYAGYTRLKNGELLRRAAADGFDALITSDKNMQFQQNLQQLPLSIVVLDTKSTAIESLRPLISALLRALGHLPPRSLINVRASD